MSKIETYTLEAETIAKDDTHGYSIPNRGGNPDYDCSNLVNTVVTNSGINVKGYGAYSTSNIYSTYKKAGFKDVTNTVNLATGSGLQRGDILLARRHHVEIYCGGGKCVGAMYDENHSTEGKQAGDQTGKEISIHGYYNYPWTDVLRYAAGTQTATKTIDEIATEVINGAWGIGNSRRYRLEQAGYDYEEVQNRVNEILNGSTVSTHKTNEEIAKEVLNGKWGNGLERKQKLTAAGYNYSEIQKIVNRLV